MHQTVRPDQAIQVANPQPEDREIPRREGVTQSNGIELWFETFGDPSEPAVLLIMGAGMPALYWPEELCEGLADAGRFVIRFDNRDAGRSTWFSDASDSPRELARSPAYTLRDMANDTIGLLDALSIRSAHLVGASLGAAIAELVATEQPERVMSLALLGHAEPVSRKEAEDAWLQVSDVSEADVTDVEWVDRLTAGAHAAAGPGYEFDEDGVRAMWTQMLETGWSPAGDLRQRAAFYFSEQASLEEVANLEIPILLLEGTADPEFDWVCQVSQTLPNTRFEAIEGMGHELPPTASELIASHILDQTTAG